MKQECNAAQTFFLGMGLVLELAKPCPGREVRGSMQKTSVFVCVCVCVLARTPERPGAHRALQDSSEGNTDLETKKKVAFMARHTVG